MSVVVGFLTVTKEGALVTSTPGYLKPGRYAIVAGNLVKEPKDPSLCAFRFSSGFPCNTTRDFHDPVIVWPKPEQAERHDFEAQP